MIGLAIREVTLSEIDKVFQLYDRDPRRPITKVRLGKGVIVYKESVNNLIELKSKIEESSDGNESIELFEESQLYGQNEEDSDKCMGYLRKKI